MGEEDFLPDREELEIQQRIQNESQISLTMKPDEQVRVSLEIGGKMFKYDLPVVNEPIEFRSKKALAVMDEIVENTPVQNLYEVLDVDKDTAFESFIIKHHQTFNNEVDMYGDIQKAGDSNLKVLEFGIPIPYDLIKDETKMKRIRSNFRFNQDIPGAIELVHPNKFLPSKLTLCFTYHLTRLQI